ncbi:hypothetical protein LSH36_583g02035 [Paralvinella palmiformis]|uniref:ABC transporter domain-containing protein n=1 Tax=Paralvinella palmiformis TaxID=53620 RepID=A0AAD9MVD0_9ANNE|nr:hypothetical protein LSH36_583g02035 [Paralvinella palmiformis]
MNPLLSVRNLGIEIHRGQMQKQQVVQDITFEVYEKEIFGVVGESGSGKTLTALSLLALLPPAAKITSGSIQFKNKDVLPYQEKVIRELRGKEISYIFQEPGRSFDPLHTIGSTMSETFRRIYPMEKQDLLTQKSIKILQDLHISHAERRLKNYPHQFSGGMLQRVMIALALIQNPQLIIADEPTTSLDVTIQAEVIRLLIELQKKRRKDLRKFRLLARYISQDPARSLDPRMTVEKILYSGIRYTSLWVNQKNAYQRAVRALELVELDSHMLSRYPVEFSGGQRQRIAIARALITEPEVLICDEIVSSLDMPIRKKILDLILRLKSLYHLSILFISHDLSTVSYVCDRIGVLYKGRLLEEARVKDLMQNPIHPYTQRLYRAIPKLEKNVFIQDLPPLQEVSDMPMREMAPEHFVAN